MNTPRSGTRSRVRAEAISIAKAADLADMRTLSFLVETIIGHNKVGIL